MNKRLLGFALAAVMGLSVSASVTPAKADLITGGFSILGDSTLNLGADTIAFAAGAEMRGVSETGTFSLVFAASNNTVTMFNQPAAFNYNTAIPIGSVFITGGNGLQFTTNALAVVSENATGVQIDMDGFFALTGFDNTLGHLTVTSQSNSQGSTVTTFSTQALAVPGPIVGAGLPGLVAACGGLLALARRRRRKFA